MKIIRASEISSYVFCHRSWWYQAHGYESENQTELSGGSTLHELHGRMVLATGCLKLLGYTLLILAVVSLTIYLTGILL